LITLNLTENKMRLKLRNNLKSFIH